MADLPNTGNTALSPPERSKRSYVRRGDRETFVPFFPTSPPQLSEYAFNIHGWALQDGVTNRGIFEVINAHTSTMTRGGFNAKLQDMRKELENGDDLYRNNLQYTARELDPGLAERDSSISQYLVVGYTLQEEDPIFMHNQTFSRYSENELVGETQPSDQHLIKWNDCRTPILVVSPIKENTGTSVRLFGLVKPKDGLCQPVLLKHERIFYRWEFRASAGAKPTQRNKNWNQLVVQKAKELTPIDKLVKVEKDVKVSLKRKRSRGFVKQEEDEYYIPEARAPDEFDEYYFELSLNFATLFEPASKTEDVLDPLSAAPVLSNIKITLDPATKAIVTDIRASRTDQILQAIRAILKTIEVPKPPELLPVDESLALAHFQIPGNEVNHGDAQLVANEIKAFWPELTFLITLDKIVYMKYVMNNLGLYVEDWNLKFFLSSAFAFIPFDCTVTEEVLAWKLSEFHRMAAALHHSHTAIANLHDTLHGDDAIFLITLLKELLVYDEWQFNIMRPVANLPALAGQNFDYRASFDINKGRQELATTVQEVEKRAKAKGCGTVDINLWMERLRLLIRQA